MAAELRTKLNRLLPVQCSAKLGHIGLTRTFNVASCGIRPITPPSVSLGTSYE